MKLLRYVLALCCFISFGAHCETMNGNDLLQKLTDRDTEGIVYLMGIVDAAEASRLVFELDSTNKDGQARKEAISKLGQFWGCRPTKASYGQVADVTISYLKNHPKVRHFESLMLIAAAMRDAWPCHAHSQ